MIEYISEETNPSSSVSLFTEYSLISFEVCSLPWTGKIIPTNKIEQYIKRVTVNILYSKMLLVIVNDSSATKNAMLAIYNKPSSGAIQCAAICTCDATMNQT
jgi:hypothetical protein